MAPSLNSTPTKRNRPLDFDYDVDTPERNTRRQLWKPTSDDWASVKESLHLSSIPDQIMCRERESSEIENFCKSHIKKEKPGSIYISGCPGTGKSLSIEKIKCKAQDWLPSEKKLAIVEINCMSLTDTKQIFNKILNSLLLEVSSTSVSKNPAIALKEVKRVVTETEKCNNGETYKPFDSLLLVIDEMDQLISKDVSVLYDIFMLPTYLHSKCILIGISNAIDLADRFLPRLRCMGCSPNLVSFPAYNKDQILTLIKQRLEKFIFTPFEPRALELCARKIAAGSGDMRKALDVCKLAIEIFISETKNDCETENEKSNEKLNISKTLIVGIKSSSNFLTIQICHMANALTDSLKSPIVDTIKTLPQHQQILLCSAAGLLSQRKDVKLGEIHTAYLKLCKNAGIYPLCSSDFVSVSNVLADQGLISVGNSKEDRLKKISFKVHQDDVVFALQGIRFFNGLLTLAGLK